MFPIFNVFLDFIKNKFVCMNKMKGIVMGAAAVCVLSACGNSGSDAGDDFDFDIVGQTSSSMGEIVSDVPMSSFGLIESSSDIEDSLSSAVDNPVEESSSSFTELPLVSSSSVTFDSAYFGEILPVSSGFEVPRSSANEILRPLSSSSMEPPPRSSASEPSRPQYARILGADISQVQEYEANGVNFLDVDGSPKDIFELLRDHGFNAIRLKTFVSPNAKYGYAVAGCNQGSGTFGPNVEAFGDKAHVIAYAKRAKAAGFKLLLDFHYSDNWADPAKQIIPERWRGVKTSDAMADSVYAYTYDVLQTLQAENALPDMVQVGNEITNGMLREVPTSNTDCWGGNVQQANSAVSGIMSNATGISNTAKYLAAGSRAVKDISNNIKTVFHIESPQKTSTVDWWMTSIIKNSKVSPDVMGFSAYTAYEHGSPDSWKTLFSNLASKYPSLEFLIAEYNGASSSNSYGFDGSRAKTHQIMEQVPRGLGAFVWEPERSGAWGTSLFDWVGGSLKANPKAFDEYKVLF